jgi:hypothetical protein
MIVPSGLDLREDLDVRIENRRVDGSRGNASLLHWYRSAKKDGSSTKRHSVHSP